MSAKQCHAELIKVRVILSEILERGDVPDELLTRMQRFAHFLQTWMVRKAA